ncbi:MAG: VWD domain-containing protein [Acidimicrobiales bacterium]
MTSSRTGAAVALVLAMLLAACSSASGDDESDAPPTTQAGSGAATPVADSDAAAPVNPFVQDLWIYDGMRTVNAEGEIVDHTDAIIEHFQESVGGAEPVELIEGMTFTPVADVSAWVKDPDGDRRDDVESIAGVIENEVGVTFAVLGTVAADGDDQIRVEDRVFIDMSFLGDAIAVDDLVATDFMLVQLVTTGDDAEADLAPLELFAHRAAAEQILWSADADGDPVIYVNEMGRIVSGSMGPEIPPKAQPMLSGFKSGIKKCLSNATIRCIPNYMKNFGKGATDSLGQIDKQLPIPPPRPYEPQYIPPPRPRDREPLACQNGGCGKSTGDPHLATFDGHRYGMQAVGEFVLARHEDDGVDVQIRTVGRPSGRISWVDVVAVGVGGSEIVVTSDGVLVDGDEVTDDELTEGVTGDGFVLTRTYTTTSIETDDGHLVTLEQRSASFIDVVVSPAADSTGWVGLLGDRDGDDSNDLVDREGTLFEVPVTFDELYQEFVMSWRVSDDESLLPYGAGESTETFTDLDYPEAPFTVDDLSADEGRMAEAACRLAGIEVEEVLEECMIDFAATGDIAYLWSAQVNDAIDGILSGRLNPDGSALSEAEESAGGGPQPDFDAGWYRTGAILRDQDEVVHSCPPTPYSMGLREFYGDNPYHISSAVCRAAVHAGLIGLEGGPVLVTRVPSRDSYPSVERNGQTSQESTSGGEGFLLSPG